MTAPSTLNLPAAAGPARPPFLREKTADYLVIALAVLLGCGSIILFAWPNRPTFVLLGLSPGTAIWWNVLVSFVFFAQHSVLVRRGVRRRLAAVIPRRYDGAFYAITSGLALAVVAVLLQPTGKPLLVLEGVPRLAIMSAALLALAGFAWGVHALHSFDMLGLRPIREHLRGESSGSQPGSIALVVRGPYRWVRHPLYTCVIVLLWADPAISAGRILLAGVWTAWIYVGARLEERDLVADFGDSYRRYRRQVPILIPWRGRVAVRIDTNAAASAAT